ncbi:MAG: hypothetical protein ACXAC7_09185 [Candidatus Hodarchaeales archaeon]|jgi:chromosome segregation ATPase
MDPDILKEKLNRSEEALSRLNEEITTQLQTNKTDFLKLDNYLDSLIQESKNLGKQIAENEANLASTKSEINSQLKFKEELSSKLDDLTKKDRENKSKLEGLETEINQITDKISSTNLEIESLHEKTTLEREQELTFGKKVNELELTLKNGIDVENLKIDELKTDLKKLKADNAVISFLLEESAEDIYEVDILSMIMITGSATKDQLKESLQNVVSPVMINRTLGRMVEKNLISYNDTDDVYTG